MPNRTSSVDRRQFIAQTALTGAAAGALPMARSLSGAEEQPARTFRVWAMGCSHVGTDQRVAKRESLAEAIRHSEQGGPGEAPAFEWDIALHLGDSSGNQGSPSAGEGREVVRQFCSGTKHRREQFYNVAGNHDASGPGEPTMEWYRTWIDPEGLHPEQSQVDPARRPYPISGNWERYSFRVGNLLFLMMSDRNDGGPPVGRDQRGGYPAGAVTGETFNWWREQVESHPDALIVSAHHHMLRETTVASGPWEGFSKKADGGWQSHYHGYFPAGGPAGASYLYFVDGKPDAQAFERYLDEHPGAIALWLGGHTHAPPDDDKGGRTHVETRWGVHFVNVAALSRYHGRKTSVPMSRLFTFTEGSKQLKVQCYLHTSQFQPVGWYAAGERTLELSKPFQLTT